METRRATTITRYIWATTANATDIIRAPSVNGERSPYPIVVIVTKAK
jgi:hypothetical protein